MSDGLDMVSDLSRECVEKDATIATQAAQIEALREIIEGVQVLIGMRLTWRDDAQKASDLNTAWWLLNRVTKIQSAPEPEHIASYLPISAALSNTGK